MIPEEYRVWATFELQRTLVTFDRDGLWTRVLRRYLPATIPVERREHLPEVPRWTDSSGEAVSGKAPPWISVVVVDRGWNESNCLGWARWRAHAPDMLMLAVVPKADDRALRWASVFGAQAAVQHLAQVPLLARCAARFWDRIPAPALGDPGRICDNLPWKPQGLE